MHQLRATTNAAIKGTMSGIVSRIAPLAMLHIVYKYHQPLAYKGHMSNLWYRIFFQEIEPF